MTEVSNGVITVASRYGMVETVNTLRAAIEAAGLHVFAHIDHAANAAEAGLVLRPTQLLIFGHPRAGTVLMAERQTAGLDLPMHALVWQDESGGTWLSFNGAQWIATRHDLGATSADTVRAIAGGMSELAAVVGR